MQVPTFVSMRAHLVLFGLAVAVSDAAFLLVAVLAGRPESISEPVVRLATLGAAGVVVTFVRHSARRAFDVAESSHHLVRAANGRGGPVIVIAGGCERDWLVQLHLELNPAALHR
jgi:hypothetical protein